MRAGGGEKKTCGTSGGEMENTIEKRRKQSGAEIARKNVKKFKNSKEKFKKNLFEFLPPRPPRPC